MTKTMTEKQSIKKAAAKDKALYSLFKKITNPKQLKSRHILKYINLREDGVAVATDSHRLLQVTDFHDKKEYAMLDGSTGESVEVTYDISHYPDTTRLIPHFSNSATLNVNETYDLLKKVIEDGKEAFKKEKLRSKIYTLNLKMDNKKITLKPTFLDVFSKFDDDDYSVEVTDLTEKFETNLNYKFLLDGLMMFKQAKIKEVTLKYPDSKVRPFVLEAENIIYLITPIRLG